LTLPVRLDLRPSRSLALVLGVLHLMALLAVTVSLSPPALVIAAIGVSLSGLAIVIGLLRRPYGGVYGLRLDHAEDADTVAWRDAAGHWHDAVLSNDGYVSTWLIVLSLAGQQGSVRVLLAPDSADAGALRTLRVWLRGRHRARPGK
jgi:hypothetical protein